MHRAAVSCRFGGQRQLFAAATAVVLNGTQAADWRKYLAIASVVRLDEDFGIFTQVGQIRLRPQHHTGHAP